MKSIPLALLVFGSLFVSAAWLATVFGTGERFGSGSLESLFTGLTLVAAAAVFAHEREKSTDSENQHRELIREMNIASRVQAISTKIHRIEMRKNRNAATRHGAIADVLMGGADATRLEAQLDQIIGLPKKG